MAAEDRRNRSEQIKEALDPLDHGESVQSWLRRQPPETLAALSRPGPAKGSGDLLGAVPAGRDQAGVGGGV